MFCSEMGASFLHYFCTFSCVGSADWSLAQPPAFAMFVKAVTTITVITMVPPMKARFGEYFIGVCEIVVQHYPPLSLNGWGHSSTHICCLAHWLCQVFPRRVIFSGRGSLKASSARCRTRSTSQQPHQQTLRSVAFFGVSSVGLQMSRLLRQRTAEGLMSPLHQAIFCLASMSGCLQRHRHCACHADSLPMAFTHPDPVRCG
jgi:hypothetical protein